MTRLTLALAAWISLASVASASLTASKKSSALINEAFRSQASRLWDHAQDQPAGGSAKSEFTVTDQTEIFLDGKPCKYAQVPSHAIVVEMEVAADNKTVLRIHFRAGK